MYNKSAFTKEQQIARLKERGLRFPNEALAIKYLSHISYYRLGEYWYVMQSDKEAHIFKPNSNFEDVVALYNFDAELRLLLFDVIEKIVFRHHGKPWSKPVLEPCPSYTVI